MTPSPASSTDSLFDEVDGEYGSDGYSRPATDTSPVVASASPPPIPGLYVFPELLPRDVANDALRSLSDADHFVGGARDQVMLFTAPPPSPSSLPSHIQELDRNLAAILTPLLPSEILDLAFSQPAARQAILNLYPPGTGISPHIDLPGRYGDGIVGASLMGGCVMTLEKGDQRHEVYLPPRSVYLLTGEARWEWSHGIPARTHDVVLTDNLQLTLPRDVRVSVTLRWMKDGSGMLA